MLIAPFNVTKRGIETYIMRSLLLLALCVGLASATGGCSPGNRISGEWQDTTPMAMIIVAFSAIIVGALVKLIVPSLFSQYQRMDSDYPKWMNFTCVKAIAAHAPASVFVLHSWVFCAFGLAATWTMEGYDKSEYSQETQYGVLTAAFIMYAIGAYFIHDAHDTAGTDRMLNWTALIVYTFIPAALIMIIIMMASDKDGIYETFAWLGFLTMLHVFSIFSHHHLLKTGTNAHHCWMFGHVSFTLAGVAGYVFLLLAMLRLPCVDGPN